MRSTWTTLLVQRHIQLTRAVGVGHSSNTGLMWQRVKLRNSACILVDYIIVVPAKPERITAHKTDNIGEILLM